MVSPTLAGAGLPVVSFLIPLIVVWLGMPPFLSFLLRRGRVLEDLHKTPPTKVPSPAGPILLLGIVSGEVIVSAFYGSLLPLALVGTAGVAFAVGLYDDLYFLGGSTKPLLLLLAAAPLIAAALAYPSIYTPSLTFPIFGSTSSHFTIYTLLVIASIPVVANAFNMMDSFNGEVSGFSVLTSLALVFAIALRTFTHGLSSERLATSLPLLAVSLAFLFFNRYPSRAFDGDSGALMLGATYAGLAVTGGVEIAAIVAITPSILNSFYILSSVRGLVERRRMEARPTYVGEDGRLFASAERTAPATLVRMLLLDGPLGEKEIVKSVLILTGVACALSAVTSLLTWAI